MSIGSFISRTTGIAVLGFIGYDAHVNAKGAAVTARERCLGNRVYAQLNRLSSLNSKSHTHNEIKKQLFRNQLDTNWRENLAGIKGYVLGFGNHLIKRIIPTALALAAASIGSIIAATGLAVMGIWTLLTDRGLGNPGANSDFFDI